MSKEPFFICSDCGSNVLAISHSWTKKTDFEQVGTVADDGRYNFDEMDKLNESDYNHEWIAYCGGCGNGVTVEWLSNERVRLLLKDSV